MNFSGLISSVGSIGPFSSRIFLPALITALLLRFGAHIPIIGHLGLLGHTAQYPTWFTSDTCIAVLAILTGLEILAQKNPEARRILNEIDIYIKPVAAALCSLGVLSATDLKTAGLFAQHASVLDDLSPIVAAVGTFGLARVRRDVVNLVLDHIEGTHLDRLLSWGEDGFVMIGVVAWVLFPILMLVLIGISTFVLERWKRRLLQIEEQGKAPCPKCGASIYPSAMACQVCRTPVVEPRMVGFLGQSKPEPDLDLAHHPYRLAEKKRCVFCADHMKHCGVGQKCPACGTVVFGDKDFADSYANFVGRRLPVVLGICFALSLVPFLGLIVGAIYYRMELVLPFNEYLPLGRRFMMRMGLRIVFFILVIFQLVPIAGAFVVPIMALLNYTAYRASFTSYVAKLHAGEEVPMGTGPTPVPAV